MEAKDLEPFSEVLKGMSNIFNQSTMSDMQIEIYWNVLKDYDFERVGNALAALMKTSQFMPRPADILNSIQGGNATDRATLAWAKVHKAIRHYGGYESVIFDDPLIHACVDAMGGWPAICRVESDQLSFTEREFSRNYNAFIASPPKQYPAKLIGRTERDNSVDGYREYISPPVMIGNPKKAKRVYEHGESIGHTVQRLTNQFIGEQA